MLAFSHARSLLPRRRSEFEPLVLEAIRAGDVA